MPPFYIALHALLCVSCILSSRRARTNKKANLALAAGALAVIILGFTVEHNPVWAWEAMRLPGDGWVFLTNLSLEGVCVLVVVMRNTAANASALRRGVLYAIPLIGAALWSYAWYFGLVPPGLQGKVDATGYCGQTSDNSCSCCAAAMLLARHHIVATEAEMAELCLTRDKLGTPALGLYRGLALKCRGHNLHPRFVRVDKPAELAALGDACIIPVGLKSSAPPAIARKMIEYGWQPGQRHAVVILKADPAGKWLDVADPTFGRERWPTKDLEYIWDGQAVYLAPQ